MYHQLVMHAKQLRLAHQCAVLCCAVLTEEQIGSYSLDIASLMPTMIPGVTRQYRHRTYHILYISCLGMQACCCCVITCCLHKSIADFKGEQHCRAYKSRPAQPFDANAVQRNPLIRLCNLIPAGSEEVILPDFGEGFGNSDGMLLGASPLS